MTKKRLAWVCLIVSPLVLGGAAFCLSDRDPITKANCDKIKRGMTEKEVDAILGTEKVSEFDRDGRPADFIWQGSRGRIIVLMGKSDPALVNLAHFIPAAPETIFEKIRNWLGL
jgi:hypothetical protein